MSIFENLQLIGTGRGKASDRKSEAETCARRILRFLREHANPAGASPKEVGFYILACSGGFDAALFDEFYEKSHQCSYEPKADLFELSFVLRVDYGATPDDVLWVKFTIELHNNEASRISRLTARTHSGTVLQSATFPRLQPGKSSEPEVINFAQKLILLIVEQAGSSRTWMNKSEGIIEKTYPDSWMSDR